VGANINAYSADAQGRPSTAAINTQSLVGQKPIMAAASVDQRTVIVTKRIATATNLTSNYHVRVSVLNVSESTCPSAFTLRTLNGDVATGPFAWNTTTSKCESAWLAVDSAFAVSSPLAGQSGRLLFDVTVNAPFPNPTTFQVELAQGAPAVFGAVRAFCPNARD
jgi:hypothetical protein